MFQELGQHGTDFGPSQVLTDTSVNARAHAKMPLNITGDVELVRVRPPVRVSVCSAQHTEKFGTFRDFHT